MQDKTDIILWVLLSLCILIMLCMAGQLAAAEITAQGRPRALYDATPASAEEYPWLVFTSGCGGSIVHPGWIVTAAHCYGDMPDRVFGRLYRTDVTIRFLACADRDTLTPIELIEVHPQLDLALAKFNPYHACEGTGQIKLPETEYTLSHPDGSHFEICGRGPSNDDSTTSIMRCRTAPLSAYQSDSAPYDDFRLDILTGKGDSGGPLMWSVAGELKLLGVGSTHSPNLYTNYARVDRGWVARTIASHPQSQQREGWGRTHENRISELEAKISLLESELREATTKPACSSMTRETTQILFGDSRPGGSFQPYRLVDFLRFIKVCE